MQGFVDQMGRAPRLLLRQKRFAVIAIVMLGLAIGLNTTMYSVLDALLFPEFPVDHGEQLYLLQYSTLPRTRVPADELFERLKTAPFVAWVTPAGIWGGRGTAVRSNQA